jgi:chromosome segregation ATPase
MAKNRLAGKLLIIPILIILVLTMATAGCKNTKKQKALAEEAAKAKAEVIKLKAESVQLKSEISYLNEKLVAANNARDKIQIQLDKLTEDQNAVTTDADEFLKENDNLKKMLAEQVKKGNELKIQLENLKAVIRELQTRIEPNKILEQSQQPVKETPADK